MVDEGPVTAPSTTTSSGMNDSTRRPNVLRGASFRVTLATALWSSSFSTTSPSASPEVGLSRRRSWWILGKFAFVTGAVVWTTCTLQQSAKYGTKPAAEIGTSSSRRRAHTATEEGDRVWLALLTGAALAGVVPDGGIRGTATQVENASLVDEVVPAASSAAPNGTGGDVDMSSKEHVIASLPPPAVNIARDYRRERRRPKLLLHVGLPKTGTTYLQCSLCSQFNTTEPILLRDNWEYLGTCPSETCEIDKRPTQFIPHSKSMFFRNFGSRRNETLSETVKSSFDGLSARGRNGIVIFEGLHAYNGEHVRDMVQSLQARFDVHVVVVYRPLYEWLISKYNSVMKRNVILRNWPGTPINVSPYGGPPVSTHLRPFDLDDRGFLSDIVQSVEETGQHPTETVMRTFGQHFAKVSVVPLHRLTREAKKQMQKQQQHEGESDGGDSTPVDPMLRYLLCNLTEGATPHACEAVQSGLIGSNIPSNPSVSFNYDHLATAAFEAGLLWPSPEQRDPASILSRNNVAYYIHQHQKRKLNRTADDFPLQCLPQETLDRLERLSRDVERRLFANDWSEEDEREHSQGFAKRVSANTYCWIDANATLADPTWIEFFDAIKARYTKR